MKICLQNLGGSANRFRAFICLLLVGLFVPSGLKAQAESEIVRFRFTCMSWDLSRENDRITHLYYQNGPDMENVRFGSGGQSREYTYAGPRKLEFFAPEKTEQGIIRHTLASVVIPRGMEKGLFLFIPSGRTRHGEQFQVIPTIGSAGQFSDGSYRFVNLSSKPFAGMVGEEKFKLNPRQDITVRPQAETGDVLEVSMAYNDGEKWVMYRKTRWGYRKSIRRVVFIYNELNGDGINIRSHADSEAYAEARARESDKPDAEEEPEAAEAAREMD